MLLLPSILTNKLNQTTIRRKKNYDKHHHQQQQKTITSIPLIYFIHWKIKKEIFEYMMRNRKKVSHYNSFCHSILNFYQLKGVSFLVFQNVFKKHPCRAVFFILAALVFALQKCLFCIDRILFTVVFISFSNLSKISWTFFRSLYFLLFMRTHTQTCIRYLLIWFDLTCLVGDDCFSTRFFCLKQPPFFFGNLVLNNTKQK